LVIIDLNNYLQEEVVEFLYKILDKIHDSNILLFNYSSPDNRQKIYKELEKISEIKEYNATSENEVINVINNKFRNKISTS